jgi:two-component system nitrate/nitrite response regulator NarL
MSSVRTSPPDATGTSEGYRRPAVRVHRTRPGLPKVVAVHDHSFVPRLIRTLLADRINLVGETLFGKAATALCELFAPDVVVTGELLGDGLVDTFLPVFVRTGCRILLVADALDVRRTLDLVEKGVTGVLDPDHSPQELADAVLVLAGGGAVLPKEMVAVIVAEWRMARRTGGAAGGAPDLTTRELEVLGAMADGMSTKAVARLLGIRPKTVENHKTRIFDKLGVRTQAQAVAVALDGRFGRSFATSATRSSP